MLRGSSGALFGAGANGTTPIWVKINVAGSPDLTAMITADPNPDCSTANTCTTTIAFVISNSGTVDVTSSFQVLIEANDISSKTITVNGLSAGTSQNFSEILDGFCYNPDCTVRVTVDSGNGIQESNDANNVAEQTFNG
jgi:archaellum component FlaG (FlaF/FlaG flagellin family)